MKKRIISTLLCFSIIVGSVPTFTAFAQGDGQSAQTELMTDTDWKCAFASPVYSEALETLTISLQCADAEIQRAIENGTVMLLAASYYGDMLMNTASGTYVNGTVTFNIPKAYSYKFFALCRENLEPVAPKFEWYYENGIIGDTAENQPIPTESDELAEATSDAVYDLAYANELVGELEKLDISVVYNNREKLAEYTQMVNEAMAAYSRVTKTAAVLGAVANKQVEDGKTQIASLQSAEDISLNATDNDAVKWAEEINRMYDSVKTGNRILGLSQQMGVDAKRAYAMLTMANNILQGKYGDEEAAEADQWMKIWTGIHTGAKVGFWTTAAIATGGTSTLVTTTATVVGGVDCALDIGKSTTTIILGDDDPAMEDIDKVCNVVGAIGFIFGLVTYKGGNSGEKLAFIGDAVEKTGIYDVFADMLYNYDHKKFNAFLTLATTPISHLTDEQKKLLNLPTGEGGKDLSGLKTKIQEKTSTDEDLKKTLIDSGLATEENVDEVFNRVIDEYEKNGLSIMAPYYRKIYTNFPQYNKQIVTQELFYDDMNRLVCHKKYSAYTNAPEEELGKLERIIDYTYVDDDDNLANICEREYDYQTGALKIESYSEDIMYTYEDYLLRGRVNISKIKYDENGDIESSSTYDYPDENNPFIYDIITTAYATYEGERYLSGYTVEKIGGHEHHDYGDTYMVLGYYPNGNLSSDILYNIYDDETLPYKIARRCTYNSDGELIYRRYFDTYTGNLSMVRDGQEWQYYTTQDAQDYRIPLDRLDDNDRLWHYHIKKDGEILPGSYQYRWVNTYIGIDGPVEEHWECKNLP